MPVRSILKPKIPQQLQLTSAPTMGLSREQETDENSHPTVDDR